MDHWRTELASSGAIGVAVDPRWCEPLRTAQADVTRMLAGAGASIVEAQLMALRSSTVIRNETAEEALASVTLMCHQLADTPPDILRKACDAYTRAPGTRFFPRSSGELFQFINPMIHDRKRLAHRLGMLAAEAERARSDKARLDGDDGLYDLDELRKIPRHMRATAVNKGWATQAQCDQLDAEDLPVPQ